MKCSDCYREYDAEDLIDGSCPECVDLLFSKVSEETPDDMRRLKGHSDRGKVTRRSAPGSFAEIRTVGARGAA